VPVRQDGLPYSDATKRRYDDPGVAVYFTLKGKPLAMARDRYWTPWENMRSLVLAIEAIRSIERHGGSTLMERAFSGFTALPAPKSCWEILGLSPCTTAQAIEAQFRAKAKTSWRQGAGGPTLTTLAANWPTPDAAISNDSEDPETFLARQDRQKARGINGNGMGTPLAMAAKLWPTPAARDVKGANGPEHMENGTGRLHLDQSPNFVPFMWSTPRSSDAEKGGPNQQFGAGGIPLPAQAAQWRTPTASDPKRGDRPDWQPDVKAGEHSLNWQAAQWMTPRVSETGQYQYDRGNPDKPVLTSQGQAQAMPSASSLPDRPISTVGEESSHIRRTLNPLFVECLMGWPRGWTSLALTPPASNASGSWGMESYLFKQRMRSALFALGLPQAAPPAQLNLFGSWNTMADLFLERDAVISDCGRYRYLLRRTWDDAPATRPRAKSRSWSPTLPRPKRRPKACRPPSIWNGRPISAPSSAGRKPTQGMTSSGRTAPTWSCG
jgi:hypothetical protein